MNKTMENKIDKFLKDKINYIVQDPDDPRVGIYAQRDVKDFIVHLVALSKKEYQEEILVSYKRCFPDTYPDGLKDEVEKQRHKTFLALIKTGGEDV